MEVVETENRQETVGESNSIVDLEKEIIVEPSVSKSIELIASSNDLAMKIDSQSSKATVEISSEPSTSQPKKRGRKKLSETTPTTKTNAPKPKTASAAIATNSSRAQSITQSTGSVSGEIPIFSNEFIEHSRSREQESRLLRKEANELEQQNGVLLKHIESLRNSTSIVEMDIEFFRRRNEQLKRSSEAFRQALRHGFQSTPLFATHASSAAPLDNIDQFVDELSSYVKNKETTPSSGGVDGHNNNELMREFSSLYLKQILTGFKLEEADLG